MATRTSLEDWGRRTIVVRSIPPRCNARILRLKFVKFGAIENAFVPWEHVDARSVEFGRLRFAKKEDAEEAIRGLDGMVWGKTEFRWIGH